MAAGGDKASEVREKVALCHICDVNQPNLFCKECTQSMCDSCKTLHDKVPDFDAHPVAPLCEKHKEPLTHICHSCIEGMCIKCILKDHIDHAAGKGFDTFSEGVENLRKKSKEFEQKIGERETKLRDELVHVEDKLRETRKAKESLRKLRAVYVDKISKVDNLLNDIEENFEAKGEKVRESFQQMIEQCENLKPTLNTNDKSDQKVIKNYAMNDTQVTGVLHRSMEMLSERFYGMEIAAVDSEYSLCLQEAGVQFLNDITQKSIKQVMHYTGEGEHKLQYPCDVVAASSDSAIVSDGKLGKWLCIRNDGELVKIYTPQQESKGAVRSATVQESYNYLLQEKTITKVCGEKLNYCSCMEPSTPDMYTCCVAGPSSFYLLCHSARAIYKYDFQTNEHTKVLQADSEIRFITKTVKSTYLVSCPGAKCIKEYDETWSLVRTIGDDELKDPRVITTTPTGHILVVDRRACNIVCFNPVGTFEKYILTKKDGLRSPVALAFCFPFLWITERGKLPSLKCFEFYST